MKCVYSKKPGRKLRKAAATLVLGMSTTTLSNSRGLLCQPERKFHSWNLAAPEGTPEFYTKQVYQNGAKCWNGPHRSVTVSVISLFFGFC
jgi:hypothetical protein